MTLLDVRPEVAAALADGKPVVALESTVVAHGLPRPRNIETALRMEETVRAEGAIPATIGILGGRLVVGLSPDEIARLGAEDHVAKVSLADLGAVVAGGGLGATTVAATMFAAHKAGIRVFATGGIGGVHRGGERSLDISADLQALRAIPVAVVCAGAKAILDLARTLEVLETLGVPVLGLGAARFPAFYCADSGLDLVHALDGPIAAARAMRAHWALGATTGLVLAAPPPDDAALPREMIDALIVKALDEAAATGVSGKAVTPFLLDHLAGASGGRTLETNIALLENNARIAARVAGAYAAGKAEPA